jgi:hypothetical protein
MRLAIEFRMSAISRNQHLSDRRARVSVVTRTTNKYPADHYETDNFETYNLETNSHQTHDSEAYHHNYYYFYGIHL